MDNRMMILDNLCYTELVYSRINKKLATTMDRQSIHSLIFSLIADKSNRIEQVGKNYYVYNQANHLRVTINSNTFRVITVDKL